MSTSEAPPLRVTSVWLRLALFLGALTLVFGVIAYILASWHNARVEKEYQELFARMDAEDANWRLDDIENAREVIAPADNSALVTARVYGLLPRPWPGQAMDPPGAQDRETNELLDGELLALYRKELEAVAPAVQEARRLADLPRGRHPLLIEKNPHDTLLPSQQNCRQSAALLRYDAELLASDGKIDEALRSARGAINAGRSLGDEMFLISQLVRIACVAIGTSSTERALGLGEASDAALAEMQQLLALEEKHRTMELGIRGERGSSHKLLAGMISGEIETTRSFSAMVAGADDKNWFSLTRWFGYSRAELRRQLIELLKVLNEAVEITKLPEHEQRAREQDLEARMNKLGKSAGLVGLLMPATAKVAEACRRKTAQVRCLRVLLALERQRLKTGKWPDRLEDLPKAYLDAIPLDPFDGKPLRYKHLRDGVLVYSVGPDGTDNGGNVVRLLPTASGTDQGFRLFDVASRRKPARPRPAEPKEDEGPAGLPGGPPPE